LQDSITDPGTLSDAWPWPAELDALRAAPAFHRVLFENEHVRVLDGHVRPGETVPLHTHRWGGVLYLLSDSEFVRRGPDGAVLADTRTAPHRLGVGAATWAGPLAPHTFENVGGHEFRTLTVELKDVAWDRQSPG
jgi:hypothetical protein